MADKIRQPLTYMLLGTERIQVIDERGTVLYFENDPSYILEMEKLLSDANANLEDVEIWEKVENALSNAPQPYFGEFKLSQAGGLYFRDYEMEVKGGIGDMVKQAKANNDLAAVAGLANFQALNMLNPNKKAQADLYDFMQYNGIVTTQRGYLLGYKAVMKMPRKLDTAVVKVLKSHKFEHADEDYLFCHDDGNYEAISHLRVKGEQTSLEFIDSGYAGYFVGRFDKLYQDLEDQESGIFVDKHTRTVQQRVGDVLSMPRIDCDPDSSVGCSTGFHVGSPEYVDWYGGRGCTVLHCLVNPADVVAVPSHDVRKLRTCQYYICGYSEMNEDGKISPIKDLMYDSEYATIEKEQIEDELRDGNFEKYIDPKIQSTSVEDAEAIIAKRLTLINS